jgi:polyphosphate kinase
MTPAIPAPPNSPPPGEPTTETGPRPADPLDPLDPSLYINRELSWLEFDARVLEEARDGSLPVLERLKFLGITSSNLDEFFMVRVAGLKQKIAAGVTTSSADGLLPAEVLAAVASRTHQLVELHDRTWQEELRPDLARAGHKLVTPRDFTPEQAEVARSRFTQEILPVLTPLAVDPGHPFPQLRNKSLNVALILRRAGRKRRHDMEVLLAVVQVPSVLPRLLRLPSPTGVVHALLDEVIAAYAVDLFPGFSVLHAAGFRVTRNWDLEIDEEESEDLVSAVQEELRRRDRGAAVRLEIAAGAADPIVEALVRALKLEPADVYPVTAPLQVQDLLQLGEADPRPELRLESWTAVLPKPFEEGVPVREAIAEGEVLLHHPYESFDPVARFVEEAADDPDVLAIKQTLYRTSGDSPFVRALSRAAENGKQVTAIVEIKARFDEANNIAWARRLEESGVHVVYGLLGLKTHCKVSLVVRREGPKLRRYVHLGTGNYNPQTARVYTDLSLFSAAPELGEDVASLFNLLTGYAEPPRWKKLTVAPFGLQEKVIELIGRETDKARRGEPARILAKMNSLVDAAVIRALYAASQAGVEVELLVRGICCLRPGVPGLSERIRVTSVVDRFLEHARVFAFGAGDNPECLLSSADWMPRNFHSRVEVMFPVEDRAIKARLVGEIFGLPLQDRARARWLQPDGSYLRAEGGAGALRSQQALCEAAMAGRGLARPTLLRQAPAPRTEQSPDRIG